MLRFVKLALNSHRIAQQWIRFVDTFHFHQGITGRRFWLDFLLDLLNFGCKFFASLIRWQIIIIFFHTIGKCIILGRGQQKKKNWAIVTQMYVIY